jgi:hypothetical protein
VSIHVLIPWRGGDPWRERVLAWVLAQWKQNHPTWPVHLGEISGDWCKADAVDAARRHVPSGSDILVVADADVWSAHVADATDQVADDEFNWALPHSQVYRLNETTTFGILESGELSITSPIGALARQPYLGVVGGGMTVLRNDLYDEAPLDPRFVGWGQEDEAWGHALHALGGRRWRGHQPLWHLWHEPAERMNQSSGSVHSVRLREQYRRFQVSGETEQIRQLIDGGRRYSAMNPQPG